MGKIRIAPSFKTWWYWTDPDSGSSGLVLHWRRIVFALALLMPLLSCLACLVLIVSSRPNELKGSFLGLLILWLWGSFVLDWPFFVFGTIVTRRLCEKWPDVEKFYWAGIGGLIGLSLPYALGYGILPFELASGSPDAGQGVGMYLFLVAPVFGVILGSLGWVLGMGAAKRFIPTKPDTV